MPDERAATRSRRTVLAAALGAGSAAVVASIAQPLAAVAATGDPAITGDTNKSSTPTVFQSSGGDALQAINKATAGSGIYGHATAATGTTYGGYFASDSAAGTGVYGVASNTFGATGVWGHSDDGAAVFGDSGSGTGVSGTSTTNTGVFGYSVHGTGLEGWTDDGYALRTRHGRVRFDDVTGIAAIPVSKSSITVTPPTPSTYGPVPVTSSSFLLLSPKANLGGRSLWFSTNPGAGTFTIHVSRAVTKKTRIAWLLLG
jgi:hypothetical protein